MNPFHGYQEKGDHYTTQFADQNDWILLKAF
jgi:hypothetical protein